MMSRFRIDRRRALGLAGSAVASAIVPLTGRSANAQTLDKVSYQTNWRAQAEHGGFTTRSPTAFTRNTASRLISAPAGRSRTHRNCCLRAALT